MTFSKIDPDTFIIVSKFLILHGHPNTSYEMVKSIIDKKKHLVTDNLTEKEKPKFGTIILDESHYIKSHDAARSKNALKICHSG